MCDEMGGEATDVSSDMAEPVDDIPEEAPDDIPEDIPEDLPEDIADDIPEDIPEDVPEDISEESVDDGLSDVSEEIPEDIAEEPVEDTAETDEEIPEDTETQSESADDNVEEPVDTPEEVPEETSDVDEPAEEPPMETADDAIETEEATDEQSSEELAEEPVEETAETAEEIPEDTETQSESADDNVEEAVDTTEEVPEETSDADEATDEHPTKAAEEGAETEEPIDKQASEELSEEPIESPAETAEALPEDTGAKSDAVDENANESEGVQDKRDNEPIKEDENALDRLRRIEQEDKKENALDRLNRLIKDDLGTELHEKYGVEKADFRDYDVKVAQSIRDAVKDAKSDFPELKVNYIGSIDTQVEGIRNELKNFYKDQINSIPNHGLTDEKVEKTAQYNADDFINKTGLNDSTGAFAWSLNIPQTLDPTGGGLSKYNGVAVNSHYASDNKLFTNAKIHEVATRHKPVGCDTPRATMDHELGHEIDNLLGACNDTEINKWYNELIQSGDAEAKLSGYSATNVKEFIAESYSEYRNNPSPREYASKVYGRLKELYAQRKV